MVQCSVCNGLGEVTITVTVNGQDTVKNIPCGLCKGTGEITLNSNG